MRPDTDPLMLLRSPLLPLPHAFTTRAGGVSLGAYAGLNLDDREDDPSLVAENRRRVAEALGFAPSRVARLNQIHGTDVLEARPGVQDGDALVSTEPGLLLAVGTADCYPILLADTVSAGVGAGVVGAAHAGWRGTLGQIAARTVEAMVERGANPANLRAAVGPGICGERYAVGGDVARQFQDAGLGDFVLEQPGGPHLDLAGANRAVLLAAGLSPGHIWVSGRCSTEGDFYSYRRDAGRTGRMWAVIGLPDPSAGTGVDA